MDIKQLSGTYDAREDRIMFRVSTTTGEEFRLLLTRLITSKLLEIIRGVATSSIAQKLPPQVAQAVAEFEREKIQAQTKLDDQFAPGATLPLGAAPVLVVALTVSRKGEELSLDLGLANASNLNLSLSPRLAQQFALLLEDLDRRGSWGLSQPIVQEAANGTAVAAAPSPKVVH